MYREAARMESSRLTVLALAANDSACGTFPEETGDERNHVANEFQDEQPVAGSSFCVTKVACTHMEVFMHSMRSSEAATRVHLAIALASCAGRLDPT
eukprot:6492053-Amphidinium_carterae.1